MTSNPTLTRQTGRHISPHFQIKSVHGPPQIDSNGRGRVKTPAINVTFDGGFVAKPGMSFRINNSEWVVDATVYGDLVRLSGRLPKRGKRKFNFEIPRQNDVCVFMGVSRSPDDDAPVIPTLFDADPMKVEKVIPPPEWAGPHDVWTDAVRTVHGMGKNFYVHASTRLRGEFGDPRGNFIFEMKGGQWNGKRLTKVAKFIITGVELDEAQARVDAQKALTPTAE